MINPITLVKLLDSQDRIPQAKRETLKPRQRRRQELRDTAKAARRNGHKKIG